MTHRPDQETPDGDETTKLQRLCDNHSRCRGLIFQEAAVAHSVLAWAQKDIAPGVGLLPPASAESRAAE
jgi:hypothetical protein